MNKVQLKAMITRSLRKQGYYIRNGRILPPARLNKATLRKLHTTAVKHQIRISRDGLHELEADLLERIADGPDITPAAIQPRLVEVAPGSADELLFRYARLHWSIPVSAGYGRRLRFLVIDQNNEKLIGLFGLSDPVFNLGARDSWIGWTPDARRLRLSHVMDAYVLGAVPPYSQLLCGKLVALLATSNEVREAFRRKYVASSSRIRRKITDARLALLTTSSALGRSSLYNRLRYANRLVYQSVGFTQGTGEFHFANGQYDHLREYASRYCEPTERKFRWGKGFRNRREVIRKCLSKIGLSKQWLSHGVGREVFVMPLASNVREFLKGDHSRLRWYDQSADALMSHFRERWLLPRSIRNTEYESWNRDEWRLWPRQNSR
ncbi:MAG: Druantia anti-phage system protein DruA [Gammaproteobacteria bacterium]